MAAISNLFVDAGSDYTATITVASGSGTPLNLSNYTAKSQMRKSFSSSIAYNFNVSIVDPASGRITLALSAADSEAIPPGRYLYDTEITHTTTGAKKRVSEGIVTITPQITRV